MKRQIRQSLKLLFLVVATISNTFVYAQDKQAELFVKKCAGCHTIGGGDLGGPDLKKSFSSTPADLLKAVTRMQNQVGPLLKEEMDDLVQFLKSQDSQNRLKQEAERESSQQEEVKLDPPDPEIGKALFYGNKPFKDGGLSCISCHDVGGVPLAGGGKLGPSLHDSYEKFGKRNLLSGIVDPKWKVMKDIYNDKKITKQEAMHLIGFLRSVQDEPLKNSSLPFLAISALISILGFALIWFFYRNRLKDVRKNLTRK